MTNPALIAPKNEHQRAFWINWTAGTVQVHCKCGWRRTEQPNRDAAVNAHKGHLAGDIQFREKTDQLAYSEYVAAKMAGELGG
jgi:hypothetical protein